MFFYLSKIIGIILNPTHLFILLLVIFSLLSFLAKPNLPKKKKLLFSIPRLRAITLFLTVIVGFNLIVPILPYYAVRTLEHRFPQPAAQDLNPEIIIVLGGWQGAGASFTSPDTPPISSAGDRLVAGLILAKKFPQAKLYFPGGLKMDHIGASEDEISRAVIKGLGLPTSQVIIEGRSRNTSENASYIRAMMDDSRQGQVVLITSASHMPRAISSFKKEGLNPLAYPVDYKTNAEKMPWTLVYKQGSVLMGTALHEWVGLVAYYVTGRTTQLLPAPKAAIKKFHN